MFETLQDLNMQETYCIFPRGNNVRFICGFKTGLFTIFSESLTWLKSPAEYAHPTRLNYHHS